MNRNNQRGFTLIELLTVIGVLGVLVWLAISAFSLYRANAAFASVQSTTSGARVDADASLSNPDIVPSTVDFMTQQSQGPLTSASAKAFMPATQVPKYISFSISFDSGCTDAGCNSVFIQARHQYGKKYQQLLRTGDGIWTTVEMDGSGW